MENARSPGAVSLGVTRRRQDGNLCVHTSMGRKKRQRMIDWIDYGRRRNTSEPSMRRNSIPNYPKGKNRRASWEVVHRLNTTRWIPKINARLSSAPKLRSHALLDETLGSTGMPKNHRALYQRIRHYRNQSCCGSTHVMTIQNYCFARRKAHTSCFNTSRDGCIAPANVIKVEV